MQRKDPKTYHNITSDPIICRNDKCQAVLNPYCKVDFHSKSWTCPFCNTYNQFPPHYAGMSPTSLPYELYYNNASIEYTCYRGSTVPPIFLFLIDTCLAAEELATVKKSIISTLNLIPPHCMIGLASFGNVVQLHELHLINGCTKVFVFKGDTDYTGKQIEEHLGLAASAASGPVAMLNNPLMNANPGINTISGMALPVNVAGSGRFLKPLSQCKQDFISILSEIHPDPWPVVSEHRPLRCTGSALSLAVSLLERSFPNTGARTLAFIGGPCTLGSGKVVTPLLRDTIRSHRDISKGSTPLLLRAYNFYSGLAKRAATVGHAIDIFSCSLDQTGLHEMQNLVNMTGGHMVLCDTFTSQLFTHALNKMFTIGRFMYRHAGATAPPPPTASNPSNPSNADVAKNSEKADQNYYRELGMGLNVTIEVKTSPSLAIAGCIGNCTSGEKKAMFVSSGSNAFGIANTNEWRLGHLDHQSTFAFYFQILDTKPQSTNPPIQQQYGPQGGQPASQNAFIQYKTTYQNIFGQRRVVVTTVARSVLFPPINENSLINSFDQEATIVLLARYAVSKAEKIENSNNLNMTKYFDRTLISICQRFARYTKNVPASFQLANTFNMFPQFIYHLRRSQLIQIFNNSPDETAFYRSRLAKASVYDSTVMIQPTLRSFVINQPPTPVLLDSKSIRPDAILLLDTFFYILVFHGSQVAAWRKQGYQDKPEYSSFLEMLRKPTEEAKALIRERFPIPRFIDCDQGGSQARFLLSKVNPSASTPAPASMLPMGAHSVSGAIDPSLQIETSVFTDDASFQTFYECLKTAVTNA